MSTPDEPSAADAAGVLARIDTAMARAGARLTALRRDIVDAESELAASHGQQLLEANEQLVLTSMRMQADADTAAQALSQASHAARFDALTGLANRVVLLDRLAQALAAAKRNSTGVAVLFLDLDDFKAINDTLGHAFGDLVLRQVADRLAGAVREVDTLSRFGGDEFVIVLGDVADAAGARLVADKLAAALAAPSQLEGHVLRLTASIGISLYPEGGEEVNSLLRQADTAMYRAKGLGPGRVAVHGDQIVAERQLNPPALASLRRPLVSVESALEQHERRHAELCEVNEKLLLAALGAQELQAAAERAQQRQTDALARIAHELRSPLGPIRTAAANLGHPRAGETARPSQLAVIERQVAHLTRLIGDLLDVSRAGTGKLRVELGSDQRR